MVSRMERIGIYEAKQRLSDLIWRVEQGECIVLTRRGEPTALIIPWELVGIIEKTLPKGEK